MPQVSQKWLREAAERQGLMLQKSRVKKAEGHGHEERYWLVDQSLNAVAVGGESGMTFDEVEAYLLKANEYAM
jgi:hypothetical protein